jgi:hypothetical protein
MKETWKAVPGYEGQYEVSDRGRVRSLDRVHWVSASRTRGPYLCKRKGRILVQSVSDKTGHLVVSLGRGDSSFVHSIVLSAFIGGRPNGLVARHINGKATDNRLANLAWSTERENSRDRLRHGAFGKLAMADVQAIKRALKVDTTYGSCARLAKKYGVSRHTIYGIKYGRRHDWV